MIGMNSSNSKYPKPKSGGLHSILFALVVVLPTMFGSLELLNLFLKPFLSLQRSTIQSSEINWDTKKLEHVVSDNNKFVEANPDVPENPPDKTRNFSFRDQQAANPEVQDQNRHSEFPKLEGKEGNTKIASPQKQPLGGKKILEFKRIEFPKLSPKVSSSNQSDKKKSKVTPKDGTKMEVKKDEPIDPIFSMFGKNPSDQTSDFTPKFTEMEKKPSRNRPKLSPELLFGPVMKSTRIAPRIGTIAIECNMHVYGVYVQQMLQAIEEQWNQLARGSIRYLQRDKLPEKITFQFILKSNGRIEKLSRVDSQGNSLPTDLCRHAIASRVPFGEWTPQMIKDFGQFDEITLSFNYK